MKLKSRKKWVAWWIEGDVTEGDVEEYLPGDVKRSRGYAKDVAMNGLTEGTVACGILNIETGERIVLVDRTEE